MNKPRARKPISAARIELDLWFVDAETYYRFAAIPLGRTTDTVTDREWIQAVDVGGDIEAVYRFTHTARNDGAQRGDSEKFFTAVCKAAGISQKDPCDAHIFNVRLLKRTVVAL